MATVIEDVSSFLVHPLKTEIVMIETANEAASPTIREKISFFMNVSRRIQEEQARIEASLKTTFPGIFLIGENRSKLAKQNSKIKVPVAN